MGNPRPPREPPARRASAGRERIRLIAHADRRPALWRQLTSRLDNLSDPIVITGGHRGGGVVLHINPAWTGLTGFTAAELLGQSALNVLFGERVDADAKAWLESLLTGGAVDEKEAAVTRRDGKRVAVRVRGSTVRFPGNEEHYVVTAHIPADDPKSADDGRAGGEGCNILSFGRPNGDGNGETIENQRLAEELVANQAGFQHSLDSCPFGVERIDGDGRILYANPIYHAILGYQENELIGENVFERLQEPEQGRALKTYLRHMLSSQPKSTPTFTTYRRKDGDHIELRLDWAYDRNRNGAISGLVSVVTPLSDRPTANPADIDVGAGEANRPPDGAAADNAGGSDRKADQELAHSLFAARVWTSILTQRHPEDEDAETLEKIDKSLGSALRILGADRRPDVPASAYYEQTLPLKGQVAVVIEPSDVLRSSTLDLLRSWGCRSVGADSPDNAVDRLVRAGRLPDLIVCDLALAIGLGGDSAIRLLWRKYGPGIPAVLVADRPAPELERFAASVGMKVLRQPLHPIELRSALLGFLREKAETRDR